MKNFSPSFFFDLSSYSHRVLFDNCKNVWTALTNIKPYLQKSSLGKILIEIPVNVTLENAEQITILEGTMIEAGAYIKGPCIVGKNCTIRQGAYLRGNMIMGDDCVIGHGAEIKESILLNGVHAAHFNYVGNSILGNGVNLGAGAICANLKFDKNPVTIHFEGEKIETGLQKLGIVMGDFSQLGCNSVSNPGTIVGKEAWCYPCLSFGGVIPSGQHVR